MNMQEVIKRDHHLAFFIYEVKTFLAENPSADWDAIDVKFPGKFGKSGAKKWMYGIIYRYAKEYKDNENTKKNMYYNMELADALLVRYNEINQNSKQRLVSNLAPIFSEEETEKLLKLI